MRLHHWSAADRHVNLFYGTGEFMSTVSLVVGALVLACTPIIWMALRAYFKHRGTRVITCPETGRPAAVEVDGIHVAASTAIGEPDLRLASCSQWPEQGCGQACLAELGAAPDECLVRMKVVEWYRGFGCSLCGRQIGEIPWGEHKPALLTVDGRTVEWDAVPPETLPQVLATHRRVCWNCHTANSLREPLPGLLTEG
jgi:hypothetical protein